MNKYKYYLVEFEHANIEYRVDQSTGLAQMNAPIVNWVDSVSFKTEEQLIKGGAIEIPQPCENK